MPGEYAALEAHKALGAGMDVLLFSDGVSLEDEVALKRRARELGLLVMGPGCGTAILDGLASASPTWSRAARWAWSPRRAPGRRRSRCCVDRAAPV